MKQAKSSAWRPEAYRCVLFKIVISTWCVCTFLSSFANTAAGSPGAKRMGLAANDPDFYLGVDCDLIPSKSIITEIAARKCKAIREDNSLLPLPEQFSRYRGNAVREFIHEACYANLHLFFKQKYLLCREQGIGQAYLDHERESNMDIIANGSDQARFGYLAKTTEMSRQYHLRMFQRYNAAASKIDANIYKYYANGINKFREISTRARTETQAAFGDNRPAIYKTYFPQHADDEQTLAAHFMKFEEEILQELIRKLKAEAQRFLSINHKLAEMRKSLCSKAAGMTDNNSPEDMDYQVYEQCWQSISGVELPATPAVEPNLQNPHLDEELVRSGLVPDTGAAAISDTMISDKPPNYTEEDIRNLGAFEPDKAEALLYHHRNQDLVPLTAEQLRERAAGALAMVNIWGNGSEQYNRGSAVQIMKDDGEVVWVSASHVFQQPADGSAGTFSLYPQAYADNPFELDTTLMTQINAEFGNAIDFAEPTMALIQIEPDQFRQLDDPYLPYVTNTADGDLRVLDPNVVHVTDLTKVEPLPIRDLATTPLVTNEPLYVAGYAAESGNRLNLIQCNYNNNSAAANSIALTCGSTYTSLGGVSGGVIMDRYGRAVAVNSYEYKTYNHEVWQQPMFFGAPMYQHGSPFSGTTLHTYPGPRALDPYYNAATRRHERPCNFIDWSMMTPGGHAKTCVIDYSTGVPKFE